MAMGTVAAGLAHGLLVRRRLGWACLLVATAIAWAGIWLLLIQPVVGGALPAALLPYQCGIGRHCPWGASQINLAGLWCLGGATICCALAARLLYRAPPRPVSRPWQAMPIPWQAMIWGAPAACGWALILALQAGVLWMGQEADPLLWGWGIAASVAIATAVDHAGFSFPRLRWPRRETWIILGCMLGFLALASSLGVSWRYAIWSDEWTFYFLAKDHAISQAHLLGVVQPGTYHPAFSHWLQGLPMRWLDPSVWSWRFSTALPVALAIWMLSMVAWWLDDRMAAVLTAAILATSHVLLAFTPWGYNNTQALIPLALGVWALSVMDRRDGLLPLALVGCACGSAWLVHGLGRLLVFPVLLGTLMIACQHRIPWRHLLIGIVPAWLAVAWPLLLHHDNWTALMRATPWSVPVAWEATGRRIVQGLLLPAYSENYTHFLVGPHTDPALLYGIVLTLGLCLSLRARPVLVLAALGWLTIIAVSAVQQYRDVSMPRMFVAPALLAPAVGMALAWWGRTLFRSPLGKRRFVWIWLLALVVGNGVHLARSLTYNARTPDSLTIRALQDALNLLDSPPGLRIVFIHPGATVFRNTVATAYGLSERLIPFDSGQPPEAINAFCGRNQERLLVIADATHADARQALAALRQCWPAAESHVFLTELGTPVALGLATPSARRMIQFD